MQSNDAQSVVSQGQHKLLLLLEDRILYLHASMYVAISDLWKGNKELDVKYTHI